MPNFNGWISLDLPSVMDIHEQRLTVTTASGTGSENTNRIIGGLMRQLLVTSTSATNTFRFTMTDENSVVRRRYDFHREMIDDTVPLPVKGVYTLQVVNARVDDAFSVIVSIEQ